jgi:biotin carboxyl carrier protein
MKLKLKKGREFQEIKVIKKDNLYQVKTEQDTDSFNLDFISKNILLFENNNNIKDLTYTIKGNTVLLYQNGKEYSYEFLDEKAIRKLSSTGGLSAGGPITVEAPMPGKIIKLLKSIGDMVKEGEPIMIMEAMKMENEMKAPYDGKITEIFVKENDTLENGDKLFAIE